MPKSRLEFVAVLFFGALGCAPTAERVSVVVPSEPAIKALATPESRPVPGVKTDAVVPSVPGRIGFVGSGDLQAKAAIQIAQKNQEHAYKEALEELRHFYQSEAYAAAREKSQSIAIDYSAQMKSLYVDLRRLFDIHADKVGPKWTRLSTVAGFPEKQGVSRKQPPDSDLIAVREFKEAEVLRREIASLQAEYRAKVTAQVEAVKQEFRLKRSDLMAERAVALDAADTKAEEDARRLAADILKNLEASFIDDFVHLPAVSGATVTVSSHASPQQWPTRPIRAAWPNTERKRQLLELFARSRHYQIVPAGPGVRDVTMEFTEWANAR